MKGLCGSPPFQMLLKDQQKSGRGHHCGDPVCDGLGIKCALRPEEGRQHKCKQHIVALSEHGQEKSCPASSQCGKPIYENVLEA